MSVYSRFKRDPEGFRKLVELLEATPVARRQKMIDVGMVEDPAYTEKALSFMMNFQDVLSMADSELMEVLAHVPAKMIGYSVAKADKKTQDRFVRCSPVQVQGEVRDIFDFETGLREIGGAQLKVVSVARKLEREGLISTKKIPVSQT